ncbi:MAG TPA: DMT family transporter [Hypericibacter adhaerens]|jgi:drug/metabolite transporter (DMT)-like permease|uniref:DMT family transporter n=1 Tax=Hypericibacter adhaerens TaxID=2602016 RepID=UPI002CDAC5CC|nr:DMT family transporter [Hypericibacter adhaerens]HWA42487.1 DMT family transporter [Hypericibacter adhaerens]
MASSSDKVAGGLLLANLAVAGSALFWGTLWWPMRQLAARGVDGPWVAVLTFATPVLFLLPVALWRRRQFLAGGRLLLGTGLLIGSSSILYADGVLVGEIVRVLLLFYLMPVWSVLFERLIIGTPVSLTRFGTIALGLVGMVVLMGFEDGFPFPRSLGDWFGLTSGVAWALGIVLVRLQGPTGAFEKTYAQFAGAVLTGILLMPLILSPVPAFPVFAVTEHWPWLIAIAVCWLVPTAGLSLWGAGQLSPVRSALLLMFEVPVGVVSSVLLTDEPFGVREMIGGALIVGAAILDVVLVPQAPEQAQAGKPA